MVYTSIINFVEVGIIARGRKKLSANEKIEVTMQSIKDCKEKINELEKQLKEFEAEKKIEEMECLYEAIQSSGKTVEEVIEMLTPTVSK